MTVIGGLLGCAGLAGWRVLVPLVHHWLGQVRSVGSAAERLTAGVTLGCSLALAVLLAWLMLSVLVCVHDRLAGLSPAEQGPTASWLRPRLVRLLLAAALGPSVGGVPGAAWSSPSPSPTGDLHVRVAGLAVPDRPIDAPRARPPHRPGARPTEASHLVRPGESLWSISETALGPRATPIDIEHGWRSLYRHNRSRVGADPDLIHPGTVLLLPTPLAAPSR